MLERPPVNKRATEVWRAFYILADAANDDPWPHRRADAEAAIATLERFLIEQFGKGIIA